jgi:hypothetical protein
MTRPAARAVSVGQGSEGEGVARTRQIRLGDGEVEDEIRHAEELGEDDGDDASDEEADVQEDPDAHELLSRHLFVGEAKLKRK